MPGLSSSVIFPFRIFIPSKQSLARSRLPSRSAHSISGHSCAAAEMATDVSVIQPIISLIPRALDSVIISLASLIPVHFISFMLIPWNAPFNRGMSVSLWHASSAIIGRGLRSVSQAWLSRSYFDIGCSTLIAAIGQKLDRTAFTEADGVLFDRRGNIAVTSALATSRPGVFAGGDCATGPTTLIGGLAHGERAAYSIDEYLSRGSVGFVPRFRMGQILRDCRLLEDGRPEQPHRKIPREKLPQMRVEDREGNFCEVDQTFTAEQAQREAARCMRCYRLYAIVTPRPIPGNERIDYQNEKVLPGA